MPPYTAKENWSFPADELLFVRVVRACAHAVARNVFFAANGAPLAQYFVGERVLELDPSSMRRWLAGVQMGFLSTVLWPPLPAGLSQFVAPLFGGASLAMFVRDYWHVTGRIATRDRRRTSA